MRLRPKHALLVILAFAAIMTPPRMAAILREIGHRRTPAGHDGDKTVQVRGRNRAFATPRLAFVGVEGRLGSRNRRDPRLDLARECRIARAVTRLRAPAPPASTAPTSHLRC